MRARTRSSLKFKGVLVLLFSVGSGFSWICVFLYFDSGASISAWVFWGLLIQAFLALVFLLVFEALIRFTSIQNIDDLWSDNDVNPCFFLGSFFLWGVFRFPDVLQLAPILWDFVKKPSSAKKTRTVLWLAPRFAKNENLFLDTTSTILNMEKFLDFWDKVVLFMTALWMVYIPIDIYYIGDKFPIISLGFGDNITMTLVHSLLGWIFLIVTPWGLIMLGTIFVWHALMPNISQRAKRFRKGA